MAVNQDVSFAKYVKSCNIKGMLITTQKKNANKGRTIEINLNYTRQLLQSDMTAQCKTQRLIDIVNTFLT